MVLWPYNRFGSASDYQVLRCPAKISISTLIYFHHLWGVLPGEIRGGQGFVGGGWAGVCWKLKQSDMSSACASRWFNAGSPNRDSQNFTRLTCECKFFEM